MNLMLTIKLYQFIATILNKDIVNKIQINFDDVFKLNDRITLYTFNVVDYKFKILIIYSEVSEEPIYGCTIAKSFFEDLKILHDPDTLNFCLKCKGQDRYYLFEAVTYGEQIVDYKVELKTYKE